MKNTRRKFRSALRSKVVIEAIKERYTRSELAQKFEHHPNQIAIWKKEFPPEVGRQGWAIIRQQSGIWRHLKKRNQQFITL